jgi:hypothetical protein
MYRVDRNNFYKHEKKATIFTPDYVSDFLYSLLSSHIAKKDGVVIDPCVGKGSLLKPWKKNGYDVMGIDIEHQGFPHTKVKNYLEVQKGEINKKVSLVIMNPPFNIDSKTKHYIKEHYGGRPLLPEVWFAKAVELFGNNVPIAMFTPYGFRLNQTENSKGFFAQPPSCRARHEGRHAESRVMPSPGGERIGGAVFMRYASA